MKQHNMLCALSTRTRRRRC